MSVLAQVSLSRVLNKIKEQGGFMDNTDIRALKEHDRLRQVLVRCGCGRFTCAVQDAEHFCDIIDASGDKDYVRDVSLPSTDPIWK